MEKTFVQIAEQHFEYLTKDYSFEKILSEESPRDHRWEGWLEYCSKSTYIEIECTRGENPSISIGRKKDVINKDKKRQHLLSIDLIYEYATLTQPEKDTVTSLLERRKAGEILYKSQLFFQLPNADSFEQQMELRLAVYASFVRKYAQPFLRGDFSQWPEIWDYSVKKGIAQQVDYGRSEYIDVVVPDGNGKFRRVGKKHLYQDKLDYIKQLKAEMKRIN
jgi:hypothetical protein